MKNEQEKSSNRHYFIAAIGIVLLCALALRSCGIQDNGSRADEVSTINHSRNRKCCGNSWQKRRSN